jgi:hypothetical protein
MPLATFIKDLCDFKASATENNVGWILVFRDGLQLRCNKLDPEIAKKLLTDKAFSLRLVTITKIVHRLTNRNQMFALILDHKNDTALNPMFNEIFCQILILCTMTIHSSVYYQNTRWWTRLTSGSLV